MFEGKTEISHQWFDFFIWGFGNQKLFIEYKVAGKPRRSRVFGSSDEPRDAYACNACGAVLLVGQPK